MQFGKKNRDDWKSGISLNSVDKNTLNFSATPSKIFKTYTEKKCQPHKSSKALWHGPEKWKFDLKINEKIFKKNINKISHEEELSVVIKKDMKLIIKLTSWGGGKNE